jgi:diphosphomevalonate decarboxylase
VSAVAHAHPNIALVKYWGKAPGPGNVPAAPSLSITLDTLVTTTEVAEAERDSFYLDDRPVTDAKVAACLDNLRRRYRIPPLTVRSRNNFPTAAGLASSASGFAALVTAVDALCGLELSPVVRSEFARQASGSAARSVFGGFVALQGPGWQARPLLDPAEWPLRVVIAITETVPKAVSSSEGMRRSAETSPYYRAWVDSTTADFAAASAAVEARDFPTLAELAEHSCLKMHGLMLSSRPGLLYWRGATIACLHQVRALRAEGADVFFTVDAGPQVKAVCLPDSEARVVEALSAVPGVTRVLVAGLGPGAWVEAR